MRDTFNKHLEDAGVDSLIPHLERWGFYTAPASTNHHCNHECGLLEHTLNVINYGLEIGDIMGYVDTPRLITACAGHDVRQG